MIAALRRKALLALLIALAIAAQAVAATCKWRGDAPAIAQATTVTVGTYDVTTTYKVTINGKTISTAGTGGTNATTATALQLLLNASVIPEFAEITWSVNSTVITGTADKAGKPFTLSTSVSGGTGTISNSTTVTNSGPNDVNIAANWSTGATPANSDNLVIENTSSSLLYNLGSLSSIGLTSLSVSQTFTGTVGLPVVNGDASTTYFEYRPQYFAIGATTVSIGGPTGQGSGRIKLNLGSAGSTTVNVTNTGNALETGLESCLIVLTGSGNVLNVSRGSVGVAVLAGESATLSLNTSQITSSNDAQVRLGSGVTLSTVKMQSGRNIINCAATTITMYGGDLTLQGTGATTTLNANGGICHYNSSGTLTNGRIAGGASLLFGANLSGATVTNMTIEKGATLLDPDSVVTWTNPPLLNRCSIPQVTIDFGSHITLAPAAGP
jgi:hypothetical protein